jgi:small nuclear ribonucleoprotein (snRNP)-like protein
MEAYYTCCRYKNKKVRLMTIHGQQYEGVITDVDRNNVYLKTAGNRNVKTSGFYPNSYNEDILTLSLFVLLAIVLI